MFVNVVDCSDFEKGTEVWLTTEDCTDLINSCNDLINFNFDNECEYENLCEDYSIDYRLIDLINSWYEHDVKVYYAEKFKSWFEFNIKNIGLYELIDSVLDELGLCSNGVYYKYINL